MEEMVAAETRKLNLGLVGAGGAVGGELLRLMEEESFPIGTLRLFGAAGSAGDVRTFAGTHHVVRPFREPALDDLDVVIVATPEDVAPQIRRHVLAAGVVTIDTSPSARFLEDVPLAVPAVNRAVLADHTGVVASPDGLVPPVALVLSRLLELGPLVALELTALVSAAARGRRGITALSQQVVAALNQRPVGHEVFSRQVAFNVIPGWEDRDGRNPAGASMDGPAATEARILRELSRIVPGLPDESGLTVAFAPVFCGASVALTAKFAGPVALADLPALFEGTPGLLVEEGTSFETLPSSLDATERSEVLISRLRVEGADGTTVRLWLTFDNLRVTARNIILILEALLADGLV